MKIEAYWMGRKVNNFIVNATDNGTGNDKFESTTLQEYTVPPGKRWFFLYGAVNRDVSSTVSVTILDVNGKEIGALTNATASTTVVPFISPGNSNLIQGSYSNIILDAGEQIKIVFGTAQSTAATIACVVMEVDL